MLGDYVIFHVISPRILASLTQRPAVTSVPPSIASADGKPLTSGNPTNKITTNLTTKESKAESPNTPHSRICGGDPDEGQDTPVGYRRHLAMGHSRRRRMWHLPGSF